MGAKDLSSASVQANFGPEYHAALLAGLVHKLNNVITVITGYCGLLELESKLPREVRDSLQHMSTAAVTLSRYIDEATIIAKDPHLNSEVIVLSELLEKSDLLKVKEIPSTEVKVKADRRRLQEICKQVCQNAAEAGARQVKLAMEQNGQMVDLKFLDDGPGMKPAVLSRAFDPFYTTKKNPVNFGLGLFKARGLLAAMNGEIMINSDGRSYTEVLVRIPSGDVHL